MSSMTAAQETKASAFATDVMKELDLLKGNSAGVVGATIASAIKSVAAMDWHMSVEDLWLPVQVLYHEYQDHPKNYYELKYVKPRLFGACSL